MPSWSALELMDAWDEASQCSPILRGQKLLEVLGLKTALVEAADLTMGESAYRMYQLREAVFGSQFTSVLSCPECNEDLEMTFDSSELQTSLEVEKTQTFTLAVGNFDLKFRLPTLNDVEVASRCETIADARLIIFEQCLLALKRNGEDVEADQAPEEIITALAREMAKIDPQGDIRLLLKCPNCGHQWSASFDIDTYLWLELDAWAKNRLAEVHALASAYGWSEEKILNMSASRRNHYLSHLVA